MVDQAKEAYNWVSRNSVAIHNLIVAGAPVRSATKVVAASDASAGWIAQADYTCDGVADDVQIQAAINALPSQGGTVQLSEGTFKTSATITITEHCHLMMQKAWIRPQSDVDVFYILPGGCITGGYIYCDDVGSSFTKAALLLDGVDTWGNVTGSSLSVIETLQFHNTSGYGDAILLIADGVATENVFFAQFRGIDIYGFQFGIHLVTANAGSINANVFRDILGAYTPYFIYLDNGGVEISGNTFVFQYQTQSPTMCVVRCKGAFNTFDGTIWDTSGKNGFVKNELLSAASPITCTIDTQPNGKGDRLRWRVGAGVYYSVLDAANITQFSLRIIGTAVGGGALDETFTQADGWTGSTTGAFATITSVTFTRTAGTGVGDYLNVDMAGLEVSLHSNVFNIASSGYPVAPSDFRDLYGGPTATLANRLYDKRVQSSSVLRIESVTGGGWMELVPSPLTDSNITITIPTAASGTLATLAATQTLTNKTLTTPVMTIPAADPNVVGQLYYDAGTKIVYRSAG